MDCKVLLHQGPADWNAWRCNNPGVLPNFDAADLSGLSAPVWESFIRKISGFNKPSKANEALFFGAVEEIARTSSRLLRSLETNAPPKDRAQEAAKAHARAVRRFGT